MTLEPLGEAWGNTVKAPRKARVPMQILDTVDDIPIPVKSRTSSDYRHLAERVKALTPGKSVGFVGYTVQGVRNAVKKIDDTGRYVVDSCNTEAYGDHVRVWHVRQEHRQAA